MSDGFLFPYDSQFSASLSLVRRCGQTVREAFLRPKVVAVKSEATDLVTETDGQVEELLRLGLAEIMAEAAFIGEESSGEGVELTDRPTWVVDPLDALLPIVDVHAHP